MRIGQESVACSNASIGILTTRRLRIAIFVAFWSSLAVSGILSPPASAQEDGRSKPLTPTNLSEKMTWGCVPVLFQLSASSEVRAF
jgi:hypothetical protein